MAHSENETKTKESIFNLRGQRRNEPRKTVADNNTLRMPTVLANVGKLACNVTAVPPPTFPAPNSSSATGSLRNKYALPPGHSLMDWIRLGSSGRDLTGFGSRSGTLTISKKELASHNKPDDAWLCIRGKVYNVTAYLAFHPGGPEELMKGVGIDATKMFEDIHPWVNYTQILSKCYIGTLSNNQIDDSQIFQGSSKISEDVTKVEEEKDRKIYPSNFIPKFDWTQSNEIITLVFYTQALSNPHVEFLRKDCSIRVLMFFNGNTYQVENTINLLHEINDDVQVKMFYETGKIEFTLRKTVKAMWTTYGNLLQTADTNSESEYAVFPFIVRNKSPLNHNTFLIELERIDNWKVLMPVGKSIQISSTVNDGKVVRFYTPIPGSVSTKLQIQKYSTPNITLLVKRYPLGVMSKLLTDANIGDSIDVSRSCGSFSLEVVQNQEMFLLLAAGTGIAPMLSILIFLLERRIRRCQRLRLLCFNLSVQDVLLQEQLEDLRECDDRFSVHYFFSEKEQNLNKDLLEEMTDDLLQDTSCTKSGIFLFVCGPPMFNSCAQRVTKELSFEDNQCYFFL